MHCFLFDARLTYCEFHALRSCSAKLPRYYHLTSLGSTLHDESKDTVTRSSHSQSIEKLVSERLALSNGRKTTVLNLGCIQGDGVFGKLEAFLDQGGEFSNASALFAQNFLGVCCTDDWPSSTKRNTSCADFDRAY